MRIDFFEIVEFEIDWKAVAFISVAIAIVSICS